MIVDNENYEIFQVAAELGVSRKTVERWLKDGELFGVRSFRRWVIPGEAVREFASKRGLNMVLMNGESLYVPVDDAERLLERTKGMRRLEVQKSDSSE